MSISLHLPSNSKDVQYSEHNSTSRPDLTKRARQEILLSDPATLEAILPTGFHPISPSKHYRTKTLASPGGNLRPGGHTWPGDLFNPARRTSQSFPPKAKRRGSLA